MKDLSDADLARELLNLEWKGLYPPSNATSAIVGEAIRRLDPKHPAFCCDKCYEVVLVAPEELDAIEGMHVCSDGQRRPDVMFRRVN